MIKEDFYKLTIGSDIYYKSGVVKIQSLYVNYRTKACRIEFYEFSEVFLFDDIMADLSFYAPKNPTKRYWIWAVKVGCWEMSEVYIDDNGKDTSGIDIYIDWNDLDKIRLDHLFVDVEEK